MPFKYTACSPIRVKNIYKLWRKVQKYFKIWKFDRKSENQASENQKSENLNTPLSEIENLKTEMKILILWSTHGVNIPDFKSENHKRNFSVLAQTFFSMGKLILSILKKKHMILMIFFWVFKVFSIFNDFLYFRSLETKQTHKKTIESFAHTYNTISYDLYFIRYERLKIMNIFVCDLVTCSAFCFHLLAR